jgi:hypothetical protein
MSISANYPNLRPSLLLDFANSQQLDPRVTFSRSTTAPYYDGKTSVLAEQNLLTYSQQIGGTNWSLQNVTASLNSATAPDGTTTASTITASVGLSAHAFYQGFGAILANTSYTKSYYLKAGTNNFASIIVNQSGSATVYCVITINLSTGAITQTVNGSSLSVSSSAIVNIGSGYYRASLTFTSTIAISSTVSILTPNSSATPTIGNYGQETWTALGTETIIVWGGQAEQRSSVTAYNATTTSAITNYIPQLLTAPINAPRFDFNPTTGESLGLLIEQSSTNLLTYSQDFSNAVWGNFNVTVNTTANIAPDGTQTFNKIQENSTSNAQFYVREPYVFSLGTYTFSFYAKLAERNWVYFEIGNTYANINLSTGALGTTGTFSTGWTFGSASATLVGNGVYRCQITSTCTIAGTYNVSIHPENANNSIVYTGTIGYGLYAWGAQLEALAFPTSYIATTSAQVTRAVDVAPLLTSGWYNIAQGTFYAEAKSIYNTSATGGARYLIANTNTNAYYLYANQGATTIQSYDGATTTSTSVSDFSVFNKFGSSYSLNTKSVTNNGLTVTSGTYNQQWGNNTILNIGSGSNGGGLPWNGWIKKLAYYPQAVTSAQLQALTGS